MTPRSRAPARAGRILVLVFLAHAGAPAQDPQPRELVVAVKEAAPFAFRDAGSWTGIAVELWREVAADLGLKTRFEPCGLNELFDGVAEGRYAAGIGALTVTAGREERVDFGHPYFESGLGIATTVRGGSQWGRILERVFSRDFLMLIGGLLAVLLAAGTLVWLFERRRNAAQFGARPRRGIGEGFWWAAVTMTTVGYGDRTPTTAGGRVVAFFWMFASLLLISFFTASIASSLTVSQLEGTVRGPEDLARTTVGTAAGTTSERYLRGKGLSHRSFPDVAAALDALAGRRLEAVVYDAPLLRYAVNQRHGGDLTVLPHRFERQAYAFAFPERSPLRERCNRHMLTRMAQEPWGRIVQRFLGE